MDLHPRSFLRFQRRVQVLVPGKSIPNSSECLGRALWPGLRWTVQVREGTVTARARERCWQTGVLTARAVSTWTRRVRCSCEGWHPGHLEEVHHDEDLTTTLFEDLARTCALSCSWKIVRNSLEIVSRGSPRSTLGTLLYHLFGQFRMGLSEGRQDSSRIHRPM